MIGFLSLLPLTSGSSLGGNIYFSNNYFLYFHVSGTDRSLTKLEERMMVRVRQLLDQVEQITKEQEVQAGILLVMMGCAAVVSSVVGSLVNYIFVVIDRKYILRLNFVLFYTGPVYCTAATYLPRAGLISC